LPFELLLLDEPFSHLDDENSEILATIIQDELVRQQAGLILTSLGNESERFGYDLILNL
jgi:putative ABC transport system ATP-binding protein